MSRLDKTDAGVEEVDEDEEVEVERRIPGSFNFESAGEGAGAGANAASPVDVLGVLGGLWRRFRLR